MSSVAVVAIRSPGFMLQSAAAHMLLQADIARFNKARNGQ